MTRHEQLLKYAGVCKVDLFEKKNYRSLAAIWADSLP